MTDRFDAYGRRVHPDATSHIDVASALLLAIGVIFGALSLWLIGFHGITPFAILPSAGATYLGMKNLIKFEAPRDLLSTSAPTEGIS